MGPVSEKLGTENSFTSKLSTISPETVNKTKAPTFAETAAPVISSSGLITPLVVAKTEPYFPPGSAFKGMVIIKSTNFCSLGPRVKLLGLTLIHLDNE